MRGNEVIAVVGAGSVGTGLAIAAKARGHRIAVVLSRTRRSARRLAKRCGARLYGTNGQIIPTDVTMLMIAVPDPEIEHVAAELARDLIGTRRRRRAFHTSGAAPSDLLRPLKKKGLAVCAIHPIHSFPAASRNAGRARSLEGEWFGIEGTAKDQTWARRFVRSLGGRSVIIPKSKKTQYHLACTFASNYPLAIMRVAELLAGMSGLKGGLVPLRSLIFDSVVNGLQNGPMRAFTGPVARGDADTLRAHRAEIRRSAPRLLPLFDELVAFSSREAEKSGRITRGQGRSVRKAVHRS